MAIYWTMGVDCGSDLNLANAFTDHFDGFVIAFPEFAPVTCKAFFETHRDIHFVCVHPRGMGNATLPKDECRPELANEAAESIARDVLYAELPRRLGFRRALFGAECFDMMAYATPDEDSDIDYGFMISSIADFPDAPADRRCDPFADGYRIVTSMHA